MLIRRRTLSRPSHKTDSVAAFLEEYCACCDVMPDSEFLHAPHTTKAIVYGLYMDRVAACDDGRWLAVSPDVFHKCWQERFPHLRLRQAMPKFSKCTRCQELTEKLAKSVNGVERTDLQRAFNMHLKVTQSHAAAVQTSACTLCISTPSA